MPKIPYVPHNFYGAQRTLVDRANAVIADYMAKGYVLTLRQLFYRLVATEVIPNAQRQYKRLGNLMVQARMAGETDWSALEDITRNVRDVRNWDGPGDAMKWLAGQYAVDMWEDQPQYVEVWIEKDALSSVFGPACAGLRVPFFSCRGYNSASEMWRASQRLIKEALRRGDESFGSESVTILHFGDHDPSGIDMTRDIGDRLCTFECVPQVIRVALNMNQVKRYKLPPNPARSTDSRHRDYVRKFGKSSWELDALEPEDLAALVTGHVAALRDDNVWAKSERREKREQKRLLAMAKKMR